MRIRFRCDPALSGHLEPPRPARDALPDWLRTMPAAVRSGTHGGTVRTVKQCPPFVDAMAHGFVIPLPCDIAVSGGRLSWDWDRPPLVLDSHPRSPVAFFAPEQVEGSPLARGTVVVKFACFWTVTLDPGWSLFATHPVNREDLPFRTLGGLVDADRFNHVGVLFPAIWTVPEFEGVLPRGTPVAQCFPVPRTSLELDCGPMDAEDQRAFTRTGHALLSEPGVYRRRFRARRPRSAGEVAPEGVEIEP